MDNQELNNYRWLDAQEHQPKKENHGSKRQEQQILQKMIDFYDV